MKKLIIIVAALMFQAGVCVAQNFTPSKSGYQPGQNGGGAVNTNVNTSVGNQNVYNPAANRAAVNRSVTNTNGNVTDLAAAIAKCEQSPIVITNAFGDYKFGMSEKEFVKVTKAAIKAKKAKRNSIGNVEYEMNFADGRTYSLILANAAFFNDKLCGLDFVFERFDGGMSDIIVEEIMQGDRFHDMDQYIVPMGYIYLKDNLEVILSRGRLSYMNLSVVNQRAKDNAERNHLSRDAF